MRGKFICLLALGLLSACGGGGGDAGGSANGDSSGSGSGSGSSGSGSSGGSAGGGVTATSHNPGMDCMSCHRSGGSGAAKGIFTVAGTVYRNNGAAQTNATVTLTPSGSSTAQATLTTDSLGNFYTTQPVASLVPAPGQQFAQGANVTVQPTGSSPHVMPGVITNGSCNSCHSSGGGVGHVTAQMSDTVSAQSAVRAMSVAGSSGDTPEPTLAQIATGAAHACVVKTNGQVLCWGTGTQGELGGEFLAETATPLAVAALGLVIASGSAGSISAGDHHTCVVSAPAGNVLCWGDNEHGQLGNGTTEAARISAVALSGVTALAASGDATCARTGTKAHADFYCWGTDNSFHSVNPAQVNPDLTLPALVALQVPSVADLQSLREVAGLESVSFTQIARQADRSCGITRDDHIKCWEGQRASVDIPLP